MRKQFYPLVCLAPLVAVALATAPASGALFLPLDNWQISLAGAPGDSSDVVTGINRAHYSATNHVVVNKQAGGTPGIVEPGDTARIEGVFNVDSFSGANGTINPPNMNGPTDVQGSWELTGRFSTTVLIETVGNGLNPHFTFSHRPDLGDPLSSGLLELYIDQYGDPSNGTTKATPSNLAGYIDGFQFASFSDTIQPEIFGLQPLSDDPFGSGGSDTSIWEFLGGEDGIVFGPDGTDLIASNLLQAIFSAEIIHGPGSQEGDPALQWNFVFPGSDVTFSLPTNFFAAGNGEVRISVVPEPSSLALAVIGATAMVGCFWRRRRLSQPVVE